jgi:hypothetical protein
MLRRELATPERVVIDAAFALMADDADYLAEAQAITQEYAVADWEAFQTGSTGSIVALVEHLGPG